ncbi:MAG: two component, sigma54 specific, transcriptional regulator, Fis family, partial [candidate division NC10 bacterium]|nr:two component, sigma54 specific, transcriptional regulator, Fis family [candidate division NC10 bacterium]
NGDIVTTHPRMLALLEFVRQVAKSHASMLIQGESGTGKELLARYIHAQSRRGSGPFVAVNCAALPEGLLESELFGHERGAFTGAIVSKPGKFELAHTGTILLDEVIEA